jgi:hypothetical protein
VEGLRFPPGNHLEGLKGDRWATSPCVIRPVAYLLCLPPNGPADVDYGLTLRGYADEPFEDPMHPGEVPERALPDSLDVGAIAFARRLGVPLERGSSG